jgi:hypothetical protein
MSSLDVSGQGLEAWADWLEIHYVPFVLAQEAKTSKEVEDVSEDLARISLSSPPARAPSPTPAPRPQKTPKTK